MVSWIPDRYIEKYLIEEVPRVDWSRKWCSIYFKQGIEVEPNNISFQDLESHIQKLFNHPIILVEYLNDPIPDQQPIPPIYDFIEDTNMVDGLEYLYATIPLYYQQYNHVYIMYWFLEFNLPESSHQRSISPI